MEEAACCPEGRATAGRFQRDSPVRAGTKAGGFQSRHPLFQKARAHGEPVSKQPDPRGNGKTHRIERSEADGQARALTRNRWEKKERKKKIQETAGRFRREAWGPRSTALSRAPGEGRAGSPRSPRRVAPTGSGSWGRAGATLGADATRELLPQALPIHSGSLSLTGPFLNVTRPAVRSATGFLIIKNPFGKSVSSAVHRNVPPPVPAPAPAAVPRSPRPPHACPRGPDRRTRPEGGRRPRWADPAAAGEAAPEARRRAGPSCGRAQPLSPAGSSPRNLRAALAFPARAA